MKALHFLPPIVSLIAAGAWIGSQRVAISRIETETSELRERIRTVGLGPEKAGERSLAGRMKEAGSEDGEIDWEELAEDLSRAQRGQMPDMRAVMELRTRLMEMDADGLLAELDRIEGLDLTKEVKQALDSMLIGMLAQKDPRTVLKRYMDWVHDQTTGMSWQLSNAFQKWQAEEPAAALAWLDAEIAKGTFESRMLDGKNATRTSFESVVMMGLLATDPAAAKDRMMAFPEDQRLDFFRQGAAIRHQGGEKAYADLVRSVLPEEQWGEAYQPSVGNLLRQGGFDEVDGLISEIEASDKERDAIVSHAVSQQIQTLGWKNQLDRAAVDEMREWAVSQAPERADAITGEALSAVWGDKSKLEERVKIIEALHDEGASDELIVSFVGGQHRDSEQREWIEPLVARIADEEKRREMMNRIGGGSAEQRSPDVEGLEVPIQE